jgi:hypothetical protein
MMVDKSSKLIERLVVTRLTYRLEQNGILSAVQSAYQLGRATTDPGLDEIGLRCNAGF